MGQHLGCCQKQTTSDLEKLECTEGQEDINLGDIQVYNIINSDVVTEQLICQSCFTFQYS